MKEDWMKVVGINKEKHIPGTGFRVALLDLGVKTNIVEELKKRKLRYHDVSLWYVL